MFNAHQVGTAALLMVLVHSAAPGQNLLRNPSFEESEQQAELPRPAAWEAWRYEGTTLRWEAGQGRNGSGAGRIDVTPQGAAAFPLFCQRFQVRPGERYRARIWTRTADVVSSWGPQLNFEFLDANGKRLPYVEGGQAGGGTHDWVELTHECYVPPEARTLLFTPFTHREGTVWFDDAELIKVADPADFTGDVVEIRVERDGVVNEDFLGFGNHGDWFLGLPANVDRGVTEADRERLRRRVASMQPKIMRLLFNYQWWEPQRGAYCTDSPQLQEMIGWISFLRSIHCDVIIHPWGDQFAYSRWMLPESDPDWWRNPNSRLPIESAREAMVHSLAQLLHFLRIDRQLDNVRYVCLMNEPDNDHARPTPVHEYVRLTRLLAHELRVRGLEQDIMLLGPDDCTGSYHAASWWWQQTLPELIDVWGGFSSHTYKHRDTRLLGNWVQDRLTMARQLQTDGPAKPLLVTEFGYVGLEGGTFDNPENTKYEYGLFMGDFAARILNSGASAALNWCLFDQYYDDVHCQHYGLWEFKDRQWRPRPAFYSWSLIMRYTAAHSRVLKVSVNPAVDRLIAAATVSPQGCLTLLIVNRHDRPIKVRVRPELPHATQLRQFTFEPQALASAGDDMLRAHDSVLVEAGAAFEVTMAAQSFHLATNLQ